MRTLIASLFFAASVIHAAAETVDLGKIIDFSDIFAMTAAEFFNSANQPGQPPSFDWVSRETRETARFPKWRNSPPVKVWGLDIFESLVTFDENGALLALKISFYNKGDSAAAGGQQAMLLDRDSFGARYKKVTSAISAWAKSPGKDGETTMMMGNRVKIRKKFWVKEPSYVAELEWSYSGRTSDFVGEYINLTLTRLTQENDPRVRRIVTTAEKRAGIPTARDLVARVSKNFKGDVFIKEFPMVDQGTKGYCVVSTLERVLKYFGSDVDQHLLAQLCQSNGVYGTQVTQMVEALKKAGVKLGVRVKENYETDNDIRDLERMVAYYNRMAKREDKGEIADGVWIKKQGNSMLYDYGAALNAMDWDVYKDVRLKKERVAYGRFVRDIHTYVDQGLPLAWTVMLGKIPEPGLNQAGGFHMRTIIGYNDKEDELIYSDSWGQGHEFKKMKLEDAWSITMNLHSLIPRH
ncbi:MAG: C39 family peptidase [Lentisphaeria bacterium]|nr:C39 family peptidase [Lentisphaeria bacterium]